METNGAVRFQNTSAVAVSSFLELLSTYLNSTFVKIAGHIVSQRNGICIGSCVAPVLSDIYLSARDGKICDRCGEFGVATAFRYVDDFLVVLNDDKECFQTRVSEVVTAFTNCLQLLTLTYECPVNDQIRFLDLRLYFGPIMCAGPVSQGATSHSFRMFRRTQS